MQIAPLSVLHLAGAVAAATGTTTVVVDFRLAPEHPFPADLEDALGAYQWLRDTGSGPITVVGDSAGGGLVMSLLLALRDQDVPQPAGAALLCPWVDLTGHPEDDPLVNPLHADLTGLPPLLVQAASGDSVLQEAQLLAQQAERCGVPVTTSIYPVPTHAFHYFWPFLPEAAAALKQLGRFVRDASLSGSARTGS